MRESLWKGCPQRKRLSSVSPEEATIRLICVESQNPLVQDVRQNHGIARVTRDPKKNRDLITADSKVLNEESE